MRVICDLEAEVIMFAHHARYGWIAIIHLRRCNCCPPVPWMFQVVAGEA